MDIFKTFIPNPQSHNPAKAHAAPEPECIHILTIITLHTESLSQQVDLFGVAKKKKVIKPTEDGAREPEMLSVFPSMAGDAHGFLAKYELTDKADEASAVSNSRHHAAPH